MENRTKGKLSVLAHSHWVRVASLMLAAGLLPVRGEERLQKANIAETLTFARIFHVAGVTGVKRNARGNLVLSTRALTFRTHNREALIVSYQRIRRITFVDANREDAKAAYAAVLTFGAPGALLLLKKHHVDALVIDFDNERGGHMLAVFQMPKKGGERCQE